MKVAVMGPGFGGSCFPKDTRALAAMGRRMGIEQGLIETLIVRNEDRKRRPGRRPFGSRITLGLATRRSLQPDD